MESERKNPGRPARSNATVGRERQAQREAMDEFGSRHIAAPASRSSKMGEEQARSLTDGRRKLSRQQTARVVMCRVCGRGREDKHEKKRSPVSANDPSPGCTTERQERLGSASEHACILPCSVTCKYQHHHHHRQVLLVGPLSHTSKTQTSHHHPLTLQESPITAPSSIFPAPRHLSTSGLSVRIFSQTRHRWGPQWSRAS
jgi:hypothetical protein